VQSECSVCLFTLGNVCVGSGVTVGSCLACDF
jgi:hypothetical protein